MPKTGEGGAETPSKAPRALALDAVRGLAILMMCLSGLVPEGLPNAMYHGYYPRFLPDNAGVWQLVADPWTHRPWWSSFTWVDWVFPMFLFAMGAAFPLAMGRKLDRGVSAWRIARSVVLRGVVLVGFAVYVRQIVPGFIEHPTSTETWLLGLLGFGLLFPVLMRLPRAWGRNAVIATRSAGVATCLGLVVYLNLGDGDTFSYAHNDIIILILAHMAVIGSLIWLVTRRSWLCRLAFLTIAYAAHHKAFYGGPGWLDPVVGFPARLLDQSWLSDWLPFDIPKGVLDLSPLYEFSLLKFLFIVIPGTIVGDALAKYLNRVGDSSGPADRSPIETAWPKRRYLALSAVLTGLILVVLTGLHCHGRVLLALGGFNLATPWATWFGVVPLCIFISLLLRGGDSSMQRLIRSLCLWGVVWLVLGLALEPYEGGITKGPPVPLSYYFVSLGLSVLLLGALTIWIDGLGLKRSFMIFVRNGQNPMLAYVGIRNLLAPVVALLLLAFVNGSPSINGFMNQWLAGSPLALLGWAAVQTLLLAVAVWGFTRRGMVWRS